MAPAGHVAENTVEHALALASRSETRQELSHVRGDDERGRVDAVALVGQHVGALRVAVVGHDQTHGLARHDRCRSTRSSGGRGRRGGRAVLLHDLEHLGGLGAGRGTHVQRQVMWLHLK